MTKNKVFAFLIVTYLAADLFAAQNMIDFFSLPEKGVKILNNFSGKPQGKNGSLVTYDIRLPKFKNGVFTSADIARWPTDTNRCLSWVFENDFKGLFSEGIEKQTVYRKYKKHWLDRPNRESPFVLLQLNSGDYLALVPLAGPQNISWLYVNQDGELQLKAGTLGTDSVSGDVPLLAWRRSPDVYTACRDAWEIAVNSEPIKGRTRLRHEKDYPEMFEHLGWCSWETYRRNINSKLLCGIADKLAASDVPIRWFLVDDGHEILSNNRLKSFEPNRGKFPNGWDPLLDKRDSDKIKWFGLWHSFRGYWGGLAPDNEFGELNKQLMRIGNSKYPKIDRESSAEFYDQLVGSAESYGFDFVKIDDQTAVMAAYRGTENAARAAAYNAQGLESAVERHGMGLINCMAQNSMCVFNTRHSNVTRCSIDYWSKSPPRTKSHLQQSYNNTLWMGQTVWPDHDMFNSADPGCARLLAVSKAMSGAPIYLSEKPEEMVAENILPLCYSNGKLLRPLAPAVPLPDSIFKNVLNDPVTYQVIAPLQNQCAAVVSYNLTEPSSHKPLSATVQQKDYCYAGAMIQPFEGQWSVPEEGLVIFDWYRQAGRKLSSYTVKLEGFSDSLALLCPIENDWAVVGRCDKYLSPSAVQNISKQEKTLKLELSESGPIVIWSGKGQPRFENKKLTPLGNGFYKADLPVKEGKCLLTITR
ncbi:Sip1-related alpha-galactosidase [Sedimentisphaera salicampi]|uniref:Sip1-related alpha-galactosidase n=1 Tax=Sedimentisphaera salicampi TaxID=1941349 RepID=UPI000B9A5EFF|nr:Sip1-related alpha-galactosidase [Sedimentisphaera salicampi]OXU15662.1 Alpha-galactosidase [Sedimentisphaera salicampi]